MDPNYPNAPIINGTTPTPPPAPTSKLFPKKLIFIGVGLLLLIITVVIVVISLNSSKKQADTGTKESSLYITRDGYGDENEAIGDATAIFAKASNKSVDFKGAPVVQPCALITLDDLKTNNILLNANSFTGPVTNLTYDGRGSQQTKKPSEYTLPLSENSASCQYGIKGDRVIEVSVLQSFNASAAALNNEIERRYTPIADVNGLKAYKVTKENNLNKNESTYLIRSANATATLRIDISDQAIKDKMLALMSERLKKAESAPTPLTTFSYKSPIMGIPMYSSCDMLTDTAFKQVVGVDAGPLTKETFASSVGVVNDPVTKKGGNYISYDCRREGVDGDGVLTMQTNTYETVEAAKNIFALEKSPSALAQNVQPITPAIGDESAFGDFAALNNSIVFRKGKLIVRVSYENPKASKIDAQQRINALRPMLEAGVKTLGDY